MYCFIYVLKEWEQVTWKISQLSVTAVFYQQYVLFRVSVLAIFSVFFWWVIIIWESIQSGGSVDVHTKIVFRHGAKKLFENQENNRHERKSWKHWLTLTYIFNIHVLIDFCCYSMVLNSLSIPSLEHIKLLLLGIMIALPWFDNGHQLRWFSSVDSNTIVKKSMSEVWLERYSEHHTHLGTGWVRCLQMFFMP